MVLDGALKMLSAQTSAAAKSMVEMNIIESRRRLEFLEGELKKLDIKASGGGGVKFADPKPAANDSGLLIGSDTARAFLFSANLNELY